MTSYVDKTGEWADRKISIFGALQSFISQLTIGDDLTKISLPSVLLYPYSALEYGGFRALNHAHLLLKANREEDELQRFLGVVRWYLSHTKSERVGKKPYNPILAETHVAWVDLSGEEYKKEGGPFKGTTKFFAEQTSHHPPITAYVVENTEEQVRMSSSVKFSTHFHGNSVTAHPEGHVYVDFYRRDERYILEKAMPDITIKNVILGTRRHPYEGDVKIRCEKTGLVANLTYFEDGWWCVNTVTGFIAKESSPDVKLFTVRGPINGLVNITNSKTNAVEPFIDLGKLHFTTLQYIPFEKLHDRMSVKLWRELSEAIVADDMYKADVAKRAVEDAQRKRRNEGNSFVPEFFEFEKETNRWNLIPGKMAQVDKFIEAAISPADQNTTASQEP